MSYRDILVHVDASAGGRQRLRFAAALAARHGARLSALHVRERSIAQQRRLKASELGLMPGPQAGRLKASIEDELDAQAGSLREMFDELLRTHRLDGMWHGVDGHARRVVTQYARYADLTVVGHDTEEDADLPEEYSFAETLLFTTGRPLLIVPTGADETVAPQTAGRHVALAWNGSAACARTLSAALPLIERAGRTTVLLVEGGGPPERLPTQTIVEHLRRHTRKADGCSLEPGDGTIGEQLQCAAREQGADLLIAGAHGRALLWEKLLGSVTRDLLAQPTIPLVMCG